MVLDRVNKGQSRPGGGTGTNAGVGFHSKRIQAGLSTQIVIQVDVPGQGKFVVGAIQSMRVAEARPLNNIIEVGTDGLIGIVPNGPTTFTITVTRVVFDFQRLPQALQREYRHIHAQRRPFDIVVTDYNSYYKGANTVTETDSTGGGGDSTTADASTGDVTATAVETTFKNCWFESSDFTYEAANYMITESATLRCETVFDSDVVTTIAQPQDVLERQTNVTSNASILSAADAKREP